MSDKLDVYEAVIKRAHNGWTITVTGARPLSKNLTDATVQIAQLGRKRYTRTYVANSTERLFEILDDDMSWEEEL